jgi:putative intracellular protease/amidase
VAAYRFELGKVTRMNIRELMVSHLSQIDHDLAVAVAAGIGVEPPKANGANHGLISPALSQVNTARVGVLGRKIAVLVADGVNEASVSSIVDTFEADGAVAEVLGPVDGSVTTDDGGRLAVTRAMTTVSSVLYDAVVVPDGDDCAFNLASDGFAVHFVAEAYKHAKAVGAVGSGVALLEQAEILVLEDDFQDETPDEEIADEELAYEEMAEADLTDNPMELADAQTNVAIDMATDVASEADVALPEGVREALEDEGLLDGGLLDDGLLDTGIVIDEEAGEDFLAAMLAAVAAHRHFDRPLDAIAA